VVRATIAALKSLRSLEQVAGKRGKQVDDIVEKKAAPSVQQATQANG
jgi:hypothetical protein